MNTADLGDITTQRQSLQILNFDLAMQFAGVMHAEAEQNYGTLRCVLHYTLTSKFGSRSVFKTSRGLRLRSVFT